MFHPEPLSNESLLVGLQYIDLRVVLVYTALVSYMLRRYQSSVVNARITVFCNQILREIISDLNPSVLRSLHFGHSFWALADDINRLVGSSVAKR